MRRTYDYTELDEVCRCGEAKLPAKSGCDDCIKEQIRRMKYYDPIAEEGGSAGAMSGRSGRVVRKGNSLS